LRDFFLSLFFFPLGPHVNIDLLIDVWRGALLLAPIVLIIKPLVFRFLLLRQEEKNYRAWSVGFRLGQISEFSLLIAILALQGSLISEKAGTLIQATAIVTFLVSSYIVVLFLPTPIAVSDSLRRD